MEKGKKIVKSLRNIQPSKVKGVRLLVLVAVLAMAAAACQSATVAVVEVEVVNGNDAAEFLDPGNPDEVYLATVTWRTRPGQAGSTTVSTIPIVGLGPVVPGNSVTVPAAAGSTTFANVSPLTLAAFNAGTVPELVGTITVAMDADNAQTSAIPDPAATPALDALSGLIQAEIVDHLESLTPNTGSTIGLVNQLNAGLQEVVYGANGGVSILSHAEATLGNLANDDLVGVSSISLVPTDTQLSAVFSGVGAGISDPDIAGSMVGGTTTNYDATVATTSGTYVLTREVTF